MFWFKKKSVSKTPPTPTIIAHSHADAPLIKVWACRDQDLVKYQEPLRALRALLPQSEVNRIERKGRLLNDVPAPGKMRVKERKANQSYMARYMIARTVSAEEGVSWQDWLSESEEQGEKNVGGSLPFFGRRGYSWGITHTEGVTMVAVTKGIKVGIDIERLITQKNVMRIAERYFDEEERALLFASSPYVTEENFFKLWTSKEAYFKYQSLMGKRIPFYQALRTCSLYWQYDFNIWGLKWERDYFFTAITSKAGEPVLEAKIFDDSF